MKKRILLLIISFVTLLSSHGQLAAYHQDVHKKMTINTINQMTNRLNTYFNDYIGETDYLRKLIWGKTARAWIEDGSWWEDITVGFYTDLLTSHYYNPYTNKGLTEAGITLGVSAYDRANDPNNFYSWKNAREYFYRGITSTIEAGRDLCLAYSLEILGHVMHLIQDMSVPAHTRDDMHVPYVDGEPYEAYTKNNSTNLNYSLVPFPYWNVSISPNAPKQFWDLDSYDGRVPYDSGYIGLSEYTHANFLSKDTMFKYFPHPARENTNYYDFGLLPYTVITTPGNINHNTFYITGYGKQHLAALKYFGEELWNLPIPLPRVYQLTLHLDKRCHEEYAQYLIPRAVGYSAGILEYFFRGKLEVTPVESNSVKIKNLSSEDMNGIFALFYDATDGNRKPVTNGLWTFSLKAGNISNPLTFTEPADIADTGKYVLVFQGQLGNESKAVVGKIFSMNYHWAIVVNRPPSWRYSARTTEISGTWKDCGPAQGCVMNATVIDSCPSASFNTYLIGSNQFLPNGTFYGGNERCDINLTSKYVGKFMKEDFLSKIYFQIDTHEEYWRQVIDDYRNLVCTLNDGTTAYPIDIYINLKNGSLAPLSWAELSLNAPELIVIKNILFPGQTITSAFKSSNFSDGGYGEWKYFSDSFSYPVTLFMVDVLSRISQDESTACYCFYTCECPNCPDFCVRVVGTIPYAGPISVYKDVKISISDVGFEFGPF